MSLIKPVSSLSIKRSVNLYTIILFISFGALLYWLATDRYQAFINTHENIASTSTRIIAFQINKSLKEQQREIDILINDTKGIITELTNNPDNVKLKQTLNAKLKRYQPDSTSFKIISASGVPVIGKLTEKEKTSYLDDVKNNTENKQHPIRLHLDEDRNGYHYNIVSNFSVDSSDYIFLVSFGVSELSNLLNSTQSAEHNLILVNREPNESIGITAQGHIKEVSGALDFKIHNGVHLSTLAKINVRDTNWYVVDMGDADLFTKHRNKMLIEYSIAYYIFIMITLFMRNILLKQDAKRTVAEEQLHKNHEQIKVLNNSLDQLSKKDSLTDLYNRRYFDEMAQHEWNRGIRTQNPLSCILLDIDHFKKYNDHYGHQAGDRCIKAIATLLRQSFRRSGDIVARYGGEEFIILMSDSNEEEAKVAIIKFQLALSKLKILHAASDTDKFVTTSAGLVVQAPSIDSSVERFVKDADNALYMAKEAGRDRWVMHKEEKKGHWASKM